MQTSTAGGKAQAKSALDGGRGFECPGRPCFLPQEKVPQVLRCYEGRKPLSARTANEWCLQMFVPDGSRHAFTTQILQETSLSTLTVQGEGKASETRFILGEGGEGAEPLVICLLQTGLGAESLNRSVEAVG